MFTIVFFLQALTRFKRILTAFLTLLNRDPSFALNRFNSIKTQNHRKKSSLVFKRCSACSNNIGFDNVDEFCTIAIIINSNQTTIMTITQQLKEGYKIAKTPLQKAKVLYWHDKVDRKIAKINALFDELEKPDPRWEAYKKRNNIK